MPLAWAVQVYDRSRAHTKPLTRSQSRGGCMHSDAHVRACFHQKYTHTQTRTRKGMAALFSAIMVSRGAACRVGAVKADCHQTTQANTSTRTRLTHRVCTYAQLRLTCPRMCQPNPNVRVSLWTVSYTPHSHDRRFLSAPTLLPRLGQAFKMNVGGVAHSQRILRGRERARQTSCVPYLEPR